MKKRTHVADPKSLRVKALCYCFVLFFSPLRKKPLFVLLYFRGVNLRGPLPVIGSDANLFEL